MLEYIWTANLLLDDILLKVVQGRGSTHFICYLLRNDEMDNFAEQEESVQQDIVSAMDPKSVDCTPLPQKYGALNSA